jgi:serine/threonine protein kinase
MPDLILNSRFKVLKKLAEGGFGQTFLAEDLHLPANPVCVVKRLKPEFPDEESYRLARRLFEQEAEILYRLGNYPAIPKLLAHFEEKGEFILVQELVEGWTLAEEFDSGKSFDEREAVEMLRQILETLAFVHSQNVIHRDIKPSNLMRRACDGKIFLIDFGAVKQVSINPFNQNHTFQSTVAIGSHGYMPSEQTAGKPRFASDLYAAGLVVIEALTGMNPLQLTQNRTTGEFLWMHKAKMTAEIGNFISRLVRYDFRQRHLSAKEAFSALNMLASSNGYGRKNVFPVQAQMPASPIRFQPQVFVQMPEIDTSLPTVPAGQNLQQTFAQPAQNNFQYEPKTESKGLFSSLWNNDFALGGIIIAAVFVCFFVLGYTVVRYAMVSGKALTENSNPVAVTDTENRVSKTFEDAETQAREAADNELFAKTKPDWDQIGDKYKQAYNKMSSIEATSSEYSAAQNKMKDYQRKSETAFQKGSMITTFQPVNSSNYNYSSTNSYPTQTSTSTTTSYNYPSPTPAKLNTVVTMPPKKSYGTYLTYNFINYDHVENKVVTANDALFTSSVEKQSDNRRDSGVVRINIDGDSYSSSHLAFKAPYGQKVTTGNFPYAQEYLWQSPTMYAVSFDKLNCFEKASHSFTINNIIYDELYATVALIDASFTISCGDRKLMGRIHYDAR